MARGKQEHREELEGPEEKKAGYREDCQGSQPLQTLASGYALAVTEDA